MIEEIKTDKKEAADMRDCSCCCDCGKSSSSTARGIGKGMGKKHPSGCSCTCPSRSSSSAKKSCPKSKDSIAGGVDKVIEEIETILTIPV